ncbi:MAG TPA: hypothetical protein VL336_06065 [Sphingomicrobium sp.]|jgi:filamentous hemagglutinin family protein|nr:hypothetical protein [Sphingomicrobium sp.]
MTRKLSVQAKVSTLALAAALAAGPSPAAAQSFQGTLNGATGATVDQSVAGQTNVTVNQSQAVINWTATNAPSGGVIVFQPDGTVATFSGASDFAVLNRVAPGTAGNAIYMGGNINSLVNGNVGGTVYFYSPNGIVIGQNAAINVGSLGLTTLPIADDGNGNWMTGFGGANPTVTFGQATDPNSYIRTDTVIDGSIRANGNGSYVALVAPSIEHKGNIRTDGAAALVAAEAATITFSPDGLFDIQVTTGTDAAQGIHVNGGTIDRNSAAEGADHRAYLVAVAKNDAVTTLIDSGGSVGFDTATSAQNGENNSVILGGGYDVAGGDHSFFSGTSQVDLTITNATLSSNVDAKVTGGIAINSGQGDLVFGNDLTAIGGAKTTSGGNVLIDGSNGHSLTIAGNLHARAWRQNADGSETGLITRLGAEGGSTVTVNGDVNLDSDSFGANAADNGLNGGNATGGSAQINIGANSSLHIVGSATVHADGYGGSQFFGDGAGGNGTGGQALVMAINGNSTVTIDGFVYASAQGFGGSTGECSSCNITGGNGIGGNASVHTNLGSGNVMTLGSDVTVIAEGQGGAGDVQAGTGIGGTANLGAGNTSTLSVAADAEVDADGFGGYGFDSTAGGLGRGGTATIGANNQGSIDLTGPVLVHSDGWGGGGLNGGTGTGGVASLSAVSGGSVHAFNDVEVSANSFGGFVNSASGTGGSGLADNETVISAAFTEASLFASAGTITVDGITLVTANATGGDGGFNGGNGGNAVGGGVPGTIGGGAVIHAANSDLGTSTIQLGTVIVTSDAQGGNGGNGQSGTNGSDGGDGGNATAGKAVVTAAAGSGDLTAGTTILSASATGGQGGDGGNGDGGSSGNGGNGGNAVGGFINVGTESGNTNFAQAANNGQATYASIIAIADATGGNGGGFFPGSPSGAPGNGGDATGGSSVLLVRGSEVTVPSVLLDASATGGDGGMDNNDVPQGIGGDAITGVVGVVVSNRFQHADQRGTLTAGNIAGTATAIGGQGSVLGGQWTQGGSTFQVINSDATIGSVGIVVTADGLAPSPFEIFNNPIVVVNGTVAIANGFAFQTPGSVSVYADDNSPLTPSLAAASINISAGNFIHDDDPSRTGPAVYGTLSANNIVLTTGQDLIVDAHMFSTNGVNFDAPGLIEFQNVRTNGPMALTAGETIDAGNLFAGVLVAANAGGNITLGSVNAVNQQVVINSDNGNIVTGPINAGTFIGLNAPLGAVTTGNLNAGTFVFESADGNIDTDDINAGATIGVDSTSGAIILANLTAGGAINLDAPGPIGFGNVTADTLDFGSGAAVTGGNIIAGTQVGGDAGTTITLGNINVGILLAGGPSEDGFAVGMSSPGSISVGNVTADEAIGFATLANLTTGNLNAGTDVMTLIGGNTTIASITTPGTGRTYHGDAQMFLDAGGSDNFDPNLVFNATPLRSGGSYTVTGAISTGRIQVGAATISTAAITAPIGIYLDSATGTATGALTSNGLIHALSGGSIQTGNLSSSGANILMDATTNIVTGTIGAATDAAFDAGGNLTIGNANLGGSLLANAGGNLTTGAVIADVIDATAGGLATLNGLWQAPDVELASNDINIGANGGIDAGNTGFIRLVSTNGTQALIGDGLTGTGYALSDAEFGRLSAGNLEILARGDASAAIDMLIGNLTITGPLAGSTIDDPFGSVTFAVGDPQAESVGGVIRITGSIRANGFTDDNSLEFFADRFELDAETGLLEITSNGTDLAGEIFIAADRVHVASSSILDQLAADPNYAGHEDDLNAPAAVQRPDGVIRAGSIEVFSNNPLAVLVQNTGTAALPAGFLTFGDEPLLTGAEGQFGPIEMIINGQLITEGGLLTGSDVLDFLIDDNNIGFFTANSMINGCLLTGNCSSPEGPIPPGSTPTPGIQDVITLIGDDDFPPPDFGNEDVIDDNDEDTDDGATSPIVPPDPLFDTSEMDEAASGGTEGPEVGTTMRSSPGLKNSGDVDDPVSGSGNPGLMENPPPPTNNQEKQP